MLYYIPKIQSQSQRKIEEALKNYLNL